MKHLVLLTSLSLISTAYGSAWNRSNNPNYFNIIAGSPMVTDLHRLPLAARLKDQRLGWSESFWPSQLGGIAFRWNHPEPRPFKYRLHGKEEILRMSEAELSQLSPAELYDIAQGDYKYSLTKKVLKTYSPEDLWWEGICHGWSLAATNYPEPDKTVVMNKDGVRVPFGSSDVKALLAMHDAFNAKGIYARIGDRCGVDGKVQGEAFLEDGEVGMPNPKDANRPECADVNAGAFHVVLSNMIGIHSKGFVADVDRFNDVWNQPIVGFSSELIGEVPVSGEEGRQGIRRKLRVVTKMSYGDELEFYSPQAAAEGVMSFVSKEPVTGTNAQLITTRSYEYILELDQSGRITGGEWISDARPDMLWTMTKNEKFRNGRFPLAGLNQIYRPVPVKNP